MNSRGRRFWLLLVAGVAALAAASSAVAAIAPTLSATTEATATTVSYTQGQSDDPPAVITFYVPAGYAALLAQPVGDVVGTVKATAVAGDLGGATLQLTGDITVAAATSTVTVAGASVPLSATATSCTGRATHSAFWIVNLTTSGQTLQVPAYVNDVPLTDPRSNFTNTTIAICLPPPDVPAGTPGRATFGAKVLSATLSLTEVFSVAPGWYLWHVVTTPYTPGTGRPNPAGTVTSQSYDRTPQELTLNVNAAGTQAVVTGRLTAGNRGVPGATVTFLVGTEAVGTTKTRPGGRYRAVVTLPSEGAKLTASATAAPSAGPCQPGWFGPGIQCSSAQYAGFTATVDPAAAEG